MKKLVFNSFILLANLWGYENPLVKNIAFGVINDNYTGSVENGESGNYLGADDFLTTSFLLRLDHRNISLDLDYNIITSRKDSFRYDLLSMGAFKSFDYLKVNHRLGLKILNKGKFLGDKVQNGFHQMMKLPKVRLPYDNYNFGLAINWEVEKNFDLLAGGDHLNVSSEIQLPTSLMPFKFGAHLSYSLSYWRINGELFTGWRGYLVDVNHYSSLIRSGFNFGGNINIDLYKGLRWNSGLGMFPAKNLVADSSYKQKEFSYTPQIWSVITFSAKPFHLKRFISHF